MKIAIHISENQGSFSTRWIEYLKGIPDCEVMEVNMKDDNIIDQIADCDGVMWHYYHIPDEKQISAKLLPAIENDLGIPVFPDYFTRWHFDEKIAQSYLFKSLNLPHIKTWVFWKYDDAIKFVQTVTGYPFVFKLSCGAGSSNIIKIDNKKQAIELVDLMFGRGVFPYTKNEFDKYSISGTPNYPRLIKRILFALKYVFLKQLPPLPYYWQLQKNYVYLQEFVPNNEFDIRITVIGGRAFGFIRHNRSNDFRASGSGLIDYDINNIPIEAIKIAFQLAAKAHLQSVGIDFLLDEKKKPLINEISYGFSSDAVHQCPGYWDDQFVWHEGHIWPEYAQAEDFLNFIRNKVELRNA